MSRYTEQNLELFPMYPRKGIRSKDVMKYACRGYAENPYRMEKDNESLKKAMDEADEVCGEVMREFEFVAVEDLSNRTKGTINMLSCVMPVIDEKYTKPLMRLSEFCYNESVEHRWCTRLNGKDQCEVTYNKLKLCAQYAKTVHSAFVAAMEAEKKEDRFAIVELKKIV